MTSPATDIEATVLCQHLASWRLHDFATNPAKGIAEERWHGTAGGGWFTMSKRDGIHWRHGTPATGSGVVRWARVAELVRAAATPELVAALGEALERKGALDSLDVQDMWARQVEGREPSPIVGRDAHEQESTRLHWLINDLGDEIKYRIRNPYPLGQTDLLDLIGAGS